MKTNINKMHIITLIPLFFLKIYICFEITSLSNFEEVSLSLTGTNHYAIYRFGRTTDTTQTKSSITIESYIQTKRNYQTTITLSIYAYKCDESKILYDETLGKFSGNFRSFFTSLDEEYEEFNFGHEKECNYLVFFIAKNSQQNFEGKFVVFNTPVYTILNTVKMSKYYFLFNNNYNFNEYNFFIDTYSFDLSKNIVVNCQMKTFSNNTFNFSVYPTNDIIPENPITNLNYNIQLEQTTRYQIKLISNHDVKDTEIKRFVVFFEIKENYNKISSLLNGAIICNNFLADSEFYYYYDISDMKLNENKYFILNFLIANLKELKLNYSIPSENIDYNNISNDDLYELASQNNYSKLKRKSETNKNIIYYKYTQNLNSSNSNILFIKISATISNVNDFTINQICTKNLQIEILNHNTYKKYFNSIPILNKIGYYYIPSKLILNNTILYCSKVDTAQIYEGEYDIVSGDANGKLISNKFFKFSNNYSNYDSGFTIITTSFGKENFLFQIENLDSKINKTLLQFTFDSLNSYNNKEIKISENISELFIISSFRNKKIDDYFILDPKIIYGNLSISYLNLDNIENDENFDLQNLFSTDIKEKYNLTEIKFPQLLNNSNELVIITNNNFNIPEKSSFGLLYLNRYNNDKQNISLGELTPIMLNSTNLRSFYYDDLINKKLYYQFFLGAQYDDVLIEIKIGNKILKLNNINSKVQGEDLEFSSNDRNIIFENKITSYSYLIWGRIEINGIQVQEVKNVKKIMLSSDYFDEVSEINKKYLFIFDWDNIINKNPSLISPYKITCSMMNQKSINSYGFYYQILTNSSKYFDFILNNNLTNSIYYEYGLNDGYSFSSGKINITEYNNFFKEKKVFNTFISFDGYIPSLKILFYMDYLSNSPLLQNQLNYLNFDDTIHYLNSPLISPSSNDKFLYYQILFCDCQSNFSIFIQKDNEEILIKDNQEKVTNYNYFGMIDLVKFNSNEKKALNFYLKTFLPQKMMFNYSYTSMDQTSENYFVEKKNFLFDDGDDYIINIENLQGELIVSFDRFAENKKVNYTLLIGNKSELKIDNECQFLQILNNTEQLQNLPHFYRENDGISPRVKIEITLEKYGNYIVYVLAHSLEIDSQYKLLGYKTYSYNDENENNPDQDKISSSVIVLLIIIVILVLFIIGFFVYHCYQRVNNFNEQNISNLNSSLLSQSFKSTDNDTDNNNMCIQLIDKPIAKEKIKNNVISNVSINDSGFNIIENENKKKNNIENKKENDNNDPNNENKTAGLDFLSPPAPAFLFQKTANPDDVIFDNAFDSRNKIKDSNEEDYKKNYINHVKTTEGL